MDYQFYRKSRPRIRSWLNKAIRRKKVVVSLLIAVPVLSFMLFSKRGIIERISLEMVKKEKMQELRLIEAKHDSLQKLYKALLSDPKEIEKIVREKYDYIREGETLYKVKREN